MTPKDFNFSLLLDRVRFTLESIEMYRLSFECGNPSIPVVDRVNELFLQTHDNLEACRKALIDHQPTDEDYNRWETIQIHTDRILEEFQTMIRTIAFKKLEDLL